MRFSQFFWQATSPLSVHVSTHSNTKGKQDKWGVSLYCKKCSPTHVYTFQIQNVLNYSFGMCKFRNGSVCSAAVQQRMGAVHGWLYRLHCMVKNIMVAVVLVVLYWWLWWLCCSVFVPIIPPQPDTLPATEHLPQWLDTTPCWLKDLQFYPLELWAKHVVLTLPCCSCPWTDYFMVSWYLWQE